MNACSTSIWANFGEEADRDFPLRDGDPALCLSALVGVVAQLVERLIRKDIPPPGPIWPSCGLTWTNASIQEVFRDFEVDPLGLIIPPISFACVQACVQGKYN